ncbi:glutathione reductase (NADPH) [Nematocida displodere]|uniref:Glutathione reductase (NADPH) n=1 Tax=Nematocida displodere TaxID=1805483 RepID=A0A177EA33_9MICR|nr:glutathione reductase (NADPH) [Nematocida displodere]
MQTYDLVVVGGGSGGLALSKRASAIYGKKTLLIDKTVLGGTCVNSGCIPKKMLYNAAALFKEHRFLQAPEERAEFNWGEFRMKRETYIQFLNNMYVRRNATDRIDVVTGEATVRGVSVKVNGVEYQGDTVVVATGSFPTLPPCPGSDLCTTSDDFFRFPSNPGKVVILGAGYIAIETAFVLAAFGSKVVLVARSSGVLRVFDELIRKNVKQALVEEGIEIFDQADVLSIEMNSGKKKVTFKKDGQNQEVVADEVISAIGRAASTEHIKAPEVTTDKSGFVETNSSFATQQQDVYAIGDLAMKDHMLTPVAIFTGRRLADLLYGTGIADIKKLIKFVPTVIFSHPPAGSVGYTEKEARKLGDDVEVCVVAVSHPAAILSANTKNQYKFIFSNKTNSLYGIHAVGAQCDEAMQGLGVLARRSTKFSTITSFFACAGTNRTDFFRGLQE